jgi:uncharacterized membrane protein YcaP (DUF421 family)
MDTLLDLNREIFGLTLKSEEMGVGQMCARALLIYIALIAIVRFGKKRFLGKATVFDAILVIIIGSIAARAITGGAPLLPSLGAEVVLVGVHWIFSAVARRSPGFSDLIKGTSTVFIKDGEVLSSALSAEHVSEDDLEEDLRQEGVAAASEVKEARLERSGRLSVLKK